MNPAFFAFLKLQPSIVQKVEERIFPNFMPQHLYEEGPTVPAIVWRRVAVERQPMQCGTDTLVRGAFEFDSYAPEYDDACAIADALRAVLLDFRGLMGTVTVGPVFLDTETQPAPEPIPGLQVESQVFTVWYQES